MASLRVFGSTSTTTIPQYDTDPVAPSAEDAWVLRDVTPVVGAPMGLLLSLTHSGSAPTKYFFSYQTISDGIKRVEVV